MRIASFTQSSTRYCNYSKDKFGNQISVIAPNGFKNQENATMIWSAAMEAADKAYQDLIALGESPEMARSVLPNSLMTEITMTANLREWRHVLQLRTAKNAHPQIREVMVELLNEFKKCIPLIFEDIVV